MRTINFNDTDLHHGKYEGIVRVIFMMMKLATIIMTVTFTTIITKTVMF